MDAWGHPFEYRVLGPDVPSFAIRSSGADGVFEEPEIDLYDVRDTHYFDCDIVLRDHMAVRRPAGVAIDFPPYAPPSPPPSPATEDPTWPEDVPASPPAADAEAPLDLVAEPPDGGAVAPAAPTSPGAPKPREARGKAPAEADLVSVPMSEAKLLHQVTPIYPPIAKKAGVHGIVVLEAIIDTSGNVTDVQVLRSVPLLDQAAMDAVRQWRFQPGQQGGRPIRMRLTVTVRFDIET
jgi:protein TonB